MTSISDEYKCKNYSTKYLQAEFNNIIKWITYHNQKRFIPGIQGWFSTHKSVNVIHPTNKMKNKNKNHMVTLIDAEKAFDKIQLNLTI